MKNILTTTAAILALSTTAMAEEITWWVPNWDETAARDLVANFEAAHPGDTVNIVITTWDTMAQQILVGLQTSSAPDVISELESRVKTYARRGLLADLTDEINELGAEDFVSSALATGEWQGSYYSVPFRHDGTGLYYNKAMLAEAGLDAAPSTWDEFFAACEALTKRDGDTITQYATAWSMGNVDNAIVRFLTVFFDQGGTLFTEDQSAVTLDTPEAAVALQIIVDTFERDCAPVSSLEVDNTGVRELFLNERIAMYPSGPFDVQPILDAGIDLGTAVLPGTDGIGVTTVDGFALMIPARSGQQEAAWRLVSFLAQPENQARLTASFPASRSALQDPKFNTEYMVPFIAQVEEGVTAPSHPQWNQIQRFMFDNIQAAILGRKTAEEAMADAHAEINASL